MTASCFARYEQPIRPSLRNIKKNNHLYDKLRYLFSSLRFVGKRFYTAMSNELPLLLRRRDVAILLSCHLNHVKNLIKQGVLIEVSIGGRGVRVTRESLLKLIAGK